VERAVDELAWEGLDRSRALIERAPQAEVVICTIGLKSGGDFNDAYLRRLAESNWFRAKDRLRVLRLISSSLI